MSSFPSSGRHDCPRRQRPPKNPGKRMLDTEVPVHDVGYLEFGSIPLRARVAAVQPGESVG